MAFWKIGLVEPHAEENGKRSRLDVRALRTLGDVPKPPRATTLNDEPADFDAHASHEAQVDTLDVVGVREVAQILTDLEIERGSDDAVATHPARTPGATVNSQEHRNLGVVDRDALRVGLPPAWLGY